MVNKREMYNNYKKESGGRCLVYLLVELDTACVYTPLPSLPYLSTRLCHFQIFAYFIESATDLSEVLWFYG